MKYSPDKIYQEFRELLDLADQIEETTWIFLDKFNQQQRKLFDFPSHQRIFLFILTRSIKTYSSIKHLCQQGYGQDVCNLLRTLLENLITVKYILHHKEKADDLAKRFVFYKWVIFRKEIGEQEKNFSLMSEQEKSDFLQRKEMIQSQVNDFKKTFNIKSDQALVTWSGYSVRDMAKYVSPKLLDEYETTFRLCSRFSHPSILGDQEYMVQDDRSLIFSPLASPIGIAPNLKSAIKYMLKFLTLVNNLYSLNCEQTLTDLQIKFEHISNLEKFQKDVKTPERTSNTPSSSIKESVIVFNTLLDTRPSLDNFQKKNS